MSCISRSLCRGPLVDLYIRRLANHLEVVAKAEPAGHLSHRLLEAVINSEHKRSVGSIVERVCAWMDRMEAEENPPAVSCMIMSLKNPFWIVEHNISSKPQNFVTRSQSVEYTQRETVRVHHEHEQVRRITFWEDVGAVALRRW